MESDGYGGIFDGAGAAAPAAYSCSIPFLDIPPSSHCSDSQIIDYSEIFGGSNGAGYFALFDYEELIRVSKKKAEESSDSSNARISTEAKLSPQFEETSLFPEEASQNLGDHSMKNNSSPSSNHNNDASKKIRLSYHRLSHDSREDTDVLHDAKFLNAGSSSSSQRHADSYPHGEVESPLRFKARLERRQQTSDRAAKALAEKNMHDVLVQREQAERNRFAESLDGEIRRWATGKEGNLRALLSTLQYILGPESGWQPIPLTDVITAAAVKKAYRKATLCVHPDKLQQRGANIQQKYICEKVFDLLKDAWSQFNSEER